MVSAKQIVYTQKIYGHTVSGTSPARAKLGNSNRNPSIALDVKERPKKVQQDAARLPPLPPPKLPGKIFQVSENVYIYNI